MTLEEFKEEWFGPEDFVIAHTSGSTGRPKEIRLLKSDMRQSAAATNKFFSINERSTLTLPLSIDYIAGKMMAVRAWQSGALLNIISPSNEFEIDSKTDLISIVPSQAMCLIAHPEWSKMIGAVIVGGGALNPSLRTALVRTGYNAYASYGMTETCSHVALMRLQEHAEATYEAMPGIEFDIDGRGCLVVVAPNFSFGKLATNDIVDLVDSRHFFWRGRFDNVINTGSIKVFPEELEREIGRYCDADFCVVGVPDDKWGERIEMVVESGGVEASDLLSILRGAMDHKRVPKRIIEVDMLPKVSNGKIDRAKARELALKA